MARLFTAGHEIRGPMAGLEGTLAGTASASFDATVARSGLSSVKCDSGASNGSANVVMPGAGQISSVPNGTTAYYRAYFRAASLPSVTAQIMSVGFNSPLRVRLTPAGNLQLYDAINAAQVGSDSAEAITAGTWFRVEVAMRIETGAADYGELRLNGTSVASSSSLNLTDSAQNAPMVCGWVTIAALPGANQVIHVDDCAINDSTGATQNTWPGEGSIVCLKPASDSARGANWTAGAGGTTNLWAAVDNTPPVGVVLGSATDTSQVKNAAKDTSGVYDAALDTYDSALAAGDTVTLVQPVAVVGNSSTTGRSVGLAGATNPTVTEATLTTGATAAATFPTGWSVLKPAVTYGDIAARSTAPVLRLRKNSSVTDSMMACFMGMVVEYVPAAGGGPTVYPQAQPMMINAASMRAATR